MRSFIALSDQSIWVEPLPWSEEVTPAKADTTYDAARTVWILTTVLAQALHRWTAAGSRRRGELRSRYTFTKLTNAVCIGPGPGPGPGPLPPSPHGTKSWRGGVCFWSPSQEQFNSFTNILQKARDLERIESFVVYSGKLHPVVYAQASDDLLLENQAVTSTFDTKQVDMCCHMKAETRLTCNRPVPTCATWHSRYQAIWMSHTWRPVYTCHCGRQSTSGTESNRSEV